MKLVNEWKQKISHGVLTKNKKDNASCSLIFFVPSSEYIYVSI